MADSVDAVPFTDGDKKSSMSVVFPPRHQNPNEARSIPANIYDAPKYKMDYQLKGKALIINNNRFSHDSNLPDREGSEKDVLAMEEALKSMEFDVVKEGNICKDDMDKIIEQVIAADFSQCGCFMCILSSHGEEGTIWATDDKMNIETDILEKFNASSASSLVGKPKIFFIQACRGQNIDAGTEIDVRLDTTGPGAEFESTQPVNPPVSETTRPAQRQPQPTPTGGKVVIPNNADFLVVHASVEGNYSVRGQDGTWFLQELAEALKSIKKDEDFLSVLTDVNAAVAFKHQFDNKSAPGQQGMKQMPCFKSTLTKSLILKP